MHGELIGSQCASYMLCTCKAMDCMTRQTPEKEIMRDCYGQKNAGHFSMAFRHLECNSPMQLPYLKQGAFWDNSDWEWGLTLVRFLA